MSTDMTIDSGSPVPESSPEPASSRLVTALVDVGIVAAWCAVVGVAGGWIWAHVTSLPQMTKTGANATVPSEELVKQVGMDGWFFVIALVGGLLSGVVLLAWRHRDPLLSVVLVTLGGGLASWLMVRVGEALGPGDPLAALRKLPDGAHVSERLQLHAHGVAWVWPIAAALGALLYLWVLSKPPSRPSPTDKVQ